MQLNSSRITNTMPETSDSDTGIIACRRVDNSCAGFLSLPPELRNAIYRYVAAPDRYMPYDYSVKLSRRPKDEAEGSEGDILEYRHRKSLGLTQVCAQIHQEFLPIHLSSLPHSLKDMALVVPYISAFDPQGTVIRGRLIINASDQVYKRCDFLPVLRLRSVSPNITWGFDNIRDHADSGIYAILHMRASKSWCDFLFHKISKFEFCLGMEDSIKIVVKSSAKEEWMPWNPELGREKKVSEKTRRAMVRWKVFNGLEHLKEMPRVLVEEE